MNAPDALAEQRALLARALREAGHDPERNPAPLDRDGTRLRSTPPVRRASMRAQPWDTNLLRQLWRGLANRIRPRRDPALSGSAGQPASLPWRRSATLRRSLLLTLILGQTWLATLLMQAVLPYHGTHPLEVAILVLYAVLFAWVGTGFWTALMGFFVLLFNGDRHAISATAAADLPVAADARCAVLLPICNEDPGRVFAGLEATWSSLQAEDAAANFDCYVLSDSSDPDARVAEQDAWMRLCARHQAFGRIFYRRRSNRVRRKSGNVADWCRRWGRNYRYMIVLDADSVMSGECMRRLLQLMEANPRAGIIQTAPRAAGMATLYARIQQMATRVYGPLFTAGLHFWQLGESHYWGHNAILRVAPFMRHCALGRIQGRGPLAGEILSHDFVEAALMRRAGWAVWIAYDLDGSYEEMPPNLLDELKRDRRWCQGNLQNAQLFTAQGLHPAHRAVFMTGVMAYLSAPLWFLFLVLSTALLAVNVLSEPVYFQEPHQLFPLWPEWRPQWAIRLFAATLVLLWLPKLLAALLVLLRPRELAGFGGPLRALGSVALESLFSALLAPVRMLFHSQFVAGALLGWKLAWQSPARGDHETPWGEAVRRHGPGTVLGLAWAGLAWWLQPDFLWWLLPVAGSLVLAIPVSVWSSRVSLGERARVARLFLVPEESMPPSVLRRLRRGLQARIPPPGFVTAVTDPMASAVARAFGISRPRRPEPVARAQALQMQVAASQGPASLDANARNAVLNDPLLLARLHQHVTHQPGSHEHWRPCH